MDGRPRTADLHRLASEKSRSAAPLCRGEKGKLLGIFGLEIGFSFILLLLSFTSSSSVTLAYQKQRQLSHPWDKSLHLSPRPLVKIEMTSVEIFVPWNLAQTRRVIKKKNSWCRSLPLNLLWLLFLWFYMTGAWGEILFVFKIFGLYKFIIKINTFLVFPLIRIF